MSNWRNPLGSEADESGFTEFQRMKINQSGGIDPAGDTTVRKLWNGSELEIKYKLFTPPVWNYVYSQANSEFDFNRILVAVDGSEEKTLAAHSGAGSNIDVKAAFNRDNIWLFERGFRHFWSNDGGDSFTLLTASAFRMNHIPCIFQDDLWTANTSDNKVYRWSGTEWTEMGTPDTSNQAGVSDIVLKCVFNHDDKIWAVGSGDGDTIKDAFLLYNSEDGITWTRTRVFNIEEDFGDIVSFLNDNSEPMTVTRLGDRLVILGTINNFSSDKMFFTITLSDLYVADSTIQNIPHDNFIDEGFYDPNYAYSQKFGKQVFFGANTMYEPIFRVFNTDGSISNYDSIINALYSGSDYEWESFYAIFLDEDTLLVAFQVYDDNIGDDIFERHEFKISTQTFTKIDSGNRWRLYQMGS